MAENQSAFVCPPYQVIISCLMADEAGKRTRDSILAKQLARRLAQQGVRAYLRSSHDGSTEISEEERLAMREATILVLAGTDPAYLGSAQVRADYDAFREAVYAEQKQKWRIVTFLSGMSADELPEAWREHRSFDRLQEDELVTWIVEKLAAQPPKACVIDAAEESVSVEEYPSAAEESATEDPLPPSDELFPAQNLSPTVRQGSRARRQGMMLEEMEEPPRSEVSLPAAPPLPSMPQNGKKLRPVPSMPIPSDLNRPIAQVVKPTKMNKVDFSVVSPEAVKPGSTSVVDVYMYTKSQRKIVDKAIKAAKEKVTESARTGSSVSVRQGSSVTVEITSEDAVIAEPQETLQWNGDALDFQFRFSLPETWDKNRKKQLDFACHVRFDGIPVTRLYFSVPVNTAKRVPVKFTRKDSRRAFVSYSSKDRALVVEQLSAIQSVAPKLRFWMDSQSMTAGDQWRPAILSAIKRADVFLLFWSRHSKESSEVRKEWEYALTLEQGQAKRGRHGERFIAPVPLESPKECPPPAELGDLHFGDPSFDAGIEHVDEVHFVTDKAKTGNIKFF